MKRAASTRICIAILVSACALAQARPPKPVDGIAARIDQAVSPYFKAREPGGAVLVAQAGQVIFRKAYGIADLRQQVSLQPTMSFRIGSLTKQFTAAAVMLLAERGRLTVNDDIRSFFPELKLEQTVSVRHLLTHTSGIPNYTEFSMANFEELPRDLLQFVQKHALEFSPGQQFRYSNTNYFLLGLIIERSSGQRYGDFLAEQVFAPLGMTQTGVSSSDAELRPVKGHRKDIGKPFVTARPPNSQLAFSAGGLVSSVDDLMRWESAIAAGKLLHSQTWKEIFSPLKLLNGDATRYGYGWAIASVTSEHVAYLHGGRIDGFSSYMLRLPDKGIFITVLMNVEGPGFSSPADIADKVLQVLVQ